MNTHGAMTTVAKGAKQAAQYRPPTGQNVQHLQATASDIYDANNKDLEIGDVVLSATASGHHGDVRYRMLMISGRTAKMLRCMHIQQFAPVLKTTPVPAYDVQRSISNHVGQNRNEQRVSGFIIPPWNVWKLGNVGRSPADITAMISLEIVKSKQLHAAISGSTPINPTGNP